MKQEAVVELRQVSKSYPAVSPDGVETPVLAAIDLTLGAGDGLAVLGPSGIGKSTLFRLLGGLDRPSDGQVLLMGRDLTQLSEIDLARTRNQQLGFIFQQPQLLPQCTAMENVLLPTLVKGAPLKGEAARQRAAALLDEVGVSGVAGKRPAALTVDERQRVAVARALIHQPKLLLADEPTGSLEARSADLMADLLSRLRRHHGMAMVIMTHSQNLASRFPNVMTVRQQELQPVTGELW